MLVIVCIDSWVDFSSPAFGVLAGVHCIGVQDTSKLDLQLDRTILVEDPVYTILVVGGCEDVGDNELVASGDDNRIITEICVLE